MFLFYKKKYQQTNLFSLLLFVLRQDSPVTKASLKVLIFLPQLPEGWTYQFPSTVGFRRKISLG